KAEPHLAIAQHGGKNVGWRRIGVSGSERLIMTCSKAKKKQPAQGTTGIHTTCKVSCPASRLASRFFSFPRCTPASFFHYPGHELSSILGQGHARNFHQLAMVASKPGRSLSSGERGRGQTGGEIPGWSSSRQSLRLRRSPFAGAGAAG